ncbi:chlorophyll a-b binding protein, chloroplastic [Haematococcus lacustris]|uniref:Chlorophyll a-b binding protein, chloroplastic n=1 Tax=Haematococcus lacustris TaxID=44745 RepID=A0A699Z7Y1_HAELA|nr:chlorophyll a-b binding protein, chloroplastic [Haematococcus lacustris]
MPGSRAVQLPGPQPSVPHPVQDALAAQLPQLQAEAEALRAEHRAARERSPWWALHRLGAGWAGQGSTGRGGQPPYRTVAASRQQRSCSGMFSGGSAHWLVQRAVHTGWSRAGSTPGRHTLFTLVGVMGWGVLDLLQLTALPWGCQRGWLGLLLHRYGSARRRLPGALGSAPHLPGHVAGDQGFDPLGLAADPAVFARLAASPRVHSYLAEDHLLRPPAVYPFPAAVSAW